MRICVFSDIHGNGPAFDAAYKMISDEKADLNIFLGDLCGYYYDQYKTVTFRCVFYEKKKLLEQIDIMADDNSYLKTVMER